MGKALPSAPSGPSQRPNQHWQENQQDEQQQQQHEELGKGRGSPLSLSPTSPPASRRHSQLPLVALPSPRLPSPASTRTHPLASGS
eukprot:348968-Rhodomonas_salina.2